MRRYQREFVAALTTLAASAYIIPVNAKILEAVGMDGHAVATANTLVIILATLAAGVYARVPMIIAPAMGMNTYLVSSIVPLANGDYRVALGVCFLSGALLLLVFLSPLQTMILQAVPRSIQGALIGGLGLILLLAGMEQAGIPRVTALVRAVGTGSELHFDLRSLSLTLVSLSITWILFRRRSPIAILSGIGVVTLIGWFLGWTTRPPELVSLPSLSGIGKLNILGALDPKFLGSIISVVFISLFDSMAAFHAVTSGANLFNSADHRDQRLQQTLRVDGFGTATAAFLGTSPTAIFVESISGIIAGGRTGWTAVFIAAMTTPLLFLGHISEMLPAAATASVLIFIGGLMMLQLRNIQASNNSERFAIVVLLAAVAATQALGLAIACAFIAYSVYQIFARRYREVSATMIVLCMLSAV